MSARSLIWPVIPARDQGCDHPRGDAASSAAAAPAPRGCAQRGSLIQTSRFLRRCSFGEDQLFLLLSAPLQQLPCALSRCQKKKRKKGGGKKEKKRRTAAAQKSPPPLELIPDPLLTRFPLLLWMSHHPLLKIYCTNTKIFL